MYDKYKSNGFVVLGFPCNQFGKQEPGSNEDILKFVSKYKVTFPIFSKVKVNGSEANAVFKFLTKRLPGYFWSFIKWNFTKFLVSRQGVPISRFGPQKNPFSFEDVIQRALSVSVKKMSTSDFVTTSSITTEVTTTTGGGMCRVSK